MNSKNSDLKQKPESQFHLSWIRPKMWIILTFVLSSGLIFSQISPVFGEVQDSNLNQAVTQVSKVKMNSFNFVFYKYCPSSNNVDMKGFLVISDKDALSVIVSPYAKPGQCQTYGVKILADNSDSIKTKSFLKKEIPSLIQDFEVKKKTLESKSVKENQKLNMYLKGGYGDKKIVEQTQKVATLNELVKSARNNIILLKST